MTTLPEKLRALAARNENARWQEDEYSTIDELREAADEIERLTAIVERLPKDESGEPILPNDTVYWIGSDGYCHKWIPYIATDGRKWYRTRESASASTP